jgi:nicotinate-nucleotide pyrophosphorylase (carboxylating)
MNLAPVNSAFPQIDWDERLQEDCRELVRLAVREDLDREHDWTTLALVPDQALARAALVARQPGVIAGLKAAELTLAEFDPRTGWSAEVNDGEIVAPGQRIALISGPARSLLTSERTLLNLLSRLSGIATLTRRYVEAISGTRARIYDTRKTTPGWRRLEKYAVRLGGGMNHRTGLFDAILIKDNHLAFGQGETGDSGFTPAAAVRRARQFLEGLETAHRSLPLEVEVDSLEQLAAVLPERPDIVLLDNMRPDELRAAVARRDEIAAGVELEASGGVNLQTVAEIARSGVDRISVGALTHGATSLDVGLDWLLEGT